MEAQYRLNPRRWRLKLCGWRLCVNCGSVDGGIFKTEDLLMEDCVNLGPLFLKFGLQMIWHMASVQ